MLHFFVHSFASAFIAPLQDQGFSSQELSHLSSFVRHQINQTDVHIRICIFLLVFLFMVSDAARAVWTWGPAFQRKCGTVRVWHEVSGPTQAFVRLIRTIIVSLVFNQTDFEISRRYAK